jgi:hypothetical protein
MLTSIIIYLITTLSALANINGEIWSAIRRISFEKKEEFPKFLISCIDDQELEGINSVKISDRIPPKNKSSKHFLVSDLQLDPMGHGFIGNVSKVEEFYKNLSFKAKGKSILFYFPSYGPSLNKIFNDCEKINREKKFLMIPCIYPTFQEKYNHKISFIGGKSHLLDEAYFTDEGIKNIELFAQNIKSICNLHKDGNLNCIMHGTGARLLNNMKSVGFNKKTFENLFLVGPDLDSDIFLNFKSNDPGHFISRIAKKIHIIYNPNDKFLKSLNRLKKTPRLGLVGSPTNNLMKSITNICQGNCEKSTHWSDVFRNHFYMQSEPLVSYINSAITLGDEKYSTAQ